eukprot:CAMPEP_0114624830 /NCGR_PEP_ID=MMETSP0168-20121206/10963_1 /TAXON_ID=95228 ORGANISM="Vannella sp., Strain DIVA3 517/6/12" /NCGR_SAMPLE_ID=MMETSP0168 /ASSEMBLY_ACC=CAM_ASM_000044 /LENGTH=88 /DNA_ID=CAMNT_0001836105 /DNA_START=258 /DNA_END=524 /DNA_ORIENTATION=+
MLTGRLTTATSGQALALYRSLLRIQRQCPPAFSRRLAENIRETFELRRSAAPEDAVRHLAQGRSMATALRTLGPVFLTLDKREAAAKR